MSWLKNQPRPLAATGNLVFGSRLAKEPLRGRAHFEEIFGRQPSFDKDALTGLLEGVRSTGYNQRMMRTYGENGMRGRSSRENAPEGNARSSSNANQGSHGGHGGHGQAGHGNHAQSGQGNSQAHNAHSSREHTPHANHGMNVVRGVRTSTPGMTGGKHYTTRYRSRRVSQREYEGGNGAGTTSARGYADKAPSSAPCGPPKVGESNDLAPHTLMGRKFLRNNFSANSSTSAQQYPQERQTSNAAYGYGSSRGEGANQGNRRTGAGFHQQQGSQRYQRGANQDMNLTLSGFGDGHQGVGESSGSNTKHRRDGHADHHGGWNQQQDDYQHQHQQQGPNSHITIVQQQGAPGGQQLCVQRPRAFAAEDANPGFRPAMEDAYIIRDNFGGDPQWSYYGCYDGHGGRQVVDYTLANMHDIFSQELIKSNFDRTQMAKIFERAFQTTDNQLRQLGAWHCGTTCTVGLIYTPYSPVPANGQPAGGVKRTLYIGNVGDSRGSIVNASSGGERLTVDHKATDPEEHARVTHEGGVISRGRVGGQLMLTRALGDFAFKASGVIAKPYFAQRELRQDDVCVVLASDGLWDVMDEIDVARIVLAGKSKKFDIKRVPQNLVDVAKSRGSADNITALAMFL